MKLDLIFIVITVAVALFFVVMLYLKLHRLQQQMDEVKGSFAMVQEENTENNAIVGDFYDNVLKADLTNNRLLGANCEHILRLLQLPADASYTQCIEAILAQMIKPEYHGLYRESFEREALLRRFARGERKFSVEFEECADLVRYRLTRATLCLSYSRVNKTIQLVSYVKDIQMEKEREQQLWHEANTDYLTGLYNKRAMEQRIHEILASDAKGLRNDALLIVDIDHFKRVNDTIGHSGGDQVLRAVAQHLRMQFREADLIGRIGGDEFLIFMGDCESPAVVEERMKKLVDAAALSRIVAQLEVEITLSIGGALCSEQGEDFADLFSRADAALYYVKEHGRNGYSISRDAPLSPMSEPDK